MIVAPDEVLATVERRQMPAFRQVVSTHPDTLTPDVIAELERRDVDVRFAWFVPRGSVYVFREERPSSDR